MNQNNSFFSSIPTVTKNLIIINLIFWIASIVLPNIGINLIKLLGLHFVTAGDFKPFQFVTYMFMHDTSSLGHLFFNMFAVFMFGRVLEQVWGPKRFLMFYMITGIGAGIIQQMAWFYELKDVLYASQDMVNMGGHIMQKTNFLNLFVTVGASGAVFGILLAFGMLFPNAPLYIMFIPIPIKAKYFVVFYGLAELTMGVYNTAGDNVAHFAHLGGMLFGFIMIKYWKKTDKGNNGQLFT
jgi:Uncharacterized membrane protein (homolog of Drosophila rhomboid)